MSTSSNRPHGVDHASVCVIGGGPAGCIAAIELARAGRKVALCTRKPASERSHCESLSPGAAYQLQFLGLSRALHASRLGEVEWKSLLWGRQTPLRLETAGSLVDRTRFDSSLRELSCQNGVVVHDVAGGVQASRKECGKWRIAARRTGSSVVTADFLVDATGLGTRLTGRRQRLGAPSLSISANASPGALPPREMFVEALETGWLWLATADDGRMSLCFFGDPGRVADHDIATSLRRRLSCSQLVGHALADIELRCVSARNASSYLQTRCASAHHVTIGDACLSRDPLLSHGVQWALTSAISGAAVANTCLAEPERTDLAVAFHRSRQADAWRSAEHACAAFYQDGFKVWKSEYWRVRAAPPRHFPRAPKRHRGRELHGEFVAFSCDAKFQTEPVIRDGIIAGATALYHPSLERPIAFVRDVPICCLLDLDPKPLKIVDLTARISKWLGHQCTRQFVSFLIETGVLTSLPPESRERMTAGSGPVMEHSP